MNTLIESKELNKILFYTEEKRNVMKRAVEIVRRLYKNMYVNNI